MQTSQVPKTHATVLQINGIEFPLIVRVNKRARRLIISVDAVRGQVLTTIPHPRHINEAIDFASERKNWIAEQFSTNTIGQPFQELSSFPFRGVEHKIFRRDDSNSRVDVGIQNGIHTITIGGHQSHLNRRVTDWLKREARNQLTQRADHYARMIGVNRGPIRIRDTRTRWGSCSANGTLSFSWRLVMAPPKILDYVAAHECAHLIHMDHSPAFWRQVKAMNVDSRKARNWFHENGHDLFRYGVVPTSAPGIESSDQVKSAA